VTTTRDRPWIGVAIVASMVLLAGCASRNATGPPPATSPTVTGTASTATTEGTVSAYTPGPIAFDAAGQLFTTDCFGGYVLRLDTSGRATIYAGNGRSSVMGSVPAPNTPRTEVELDCPAGLAFEPSGVLLVVAHADNRIVAIQPDGTVRTVVGDGPPGTASDDGTLAGDGGPAVKATLQEPTELVLGHSGDFYFADRDNHAVRRVDRNGVITTEAGTGNPGYSGDGGPARKARIQRPGSPVVTPDGDLYFTDGEGTYLRRVDKKGIISTIAGQGTAHRIDPQALALDPSGHLVVSDTSSVRRLSPTGTLTTIAGTPNADAQGNEACTGIGGPASHAVITPVGLAYGPGGALFIATNTCGVLRLGPDGILTQYIPAPAQ
jgi:sugar lactone lactonase YvrE